MIIGLDVGGTHTDVVLLGETGVIKEVKVPTVSSDLFSTVLSGLDEITRDIPPEEIRRVVLSTTLTTNVIAQGKAPAVGMIVAAGPGIDPLLFCTNDHYAAVAGALDHRGRETEPLDEDEIRTIADTYEAAGIRHVGIVGKFSVRNPVHELAIEKILGNRFGRLFLGHRVSGVLNFPRRIATTFLNASIYPVHKEFYAAVQKSLTEKGLSLPIRILKADGGNMRFEASIEHPAQTILSGPAASVMGSIAFAPKKGECLVMDIGGTTTDMAVLIDGVPLLDPLGIEIGGFKTLIRSLKTFSMPIGGDSRVAVKDGAIAIGPERAGVAMAYGGPEPTPTDAFFVLGMQDNGDTERAMAGIAGIASELGVDARTAAEQVISTACQNILIGAADMVDRINSKPVYTVHELWEGKEVRPDRILILGGPAPLFARALNEKSGYKVTVIPRWTVANAIGAALARTTSDVVLLADTQQGVVAAPMEGFSRSIPKEFSLKDATDIAIEILTEKAIQRGANPDHLETEIIEQMQFNMIRGFRTEGKNIRIRAQVKPGLIHGYDPVSEKMSEDIS
ncbi:MAG: hydantoinase/oxoprolinase family protein [Desulfobacteraceae bacterium]|nr:hydantoinase/oxoprolinase family protein [Desulfobacteraceae bacterium]